ncbi:MAG: helix-turn-helix transcriptional regulator [Clostridiales bacterium]|nr:helix-turn-helix transcriptional regulator [Clostridiales bacterium]
MSFFEDMQRDLTEAIVMEKGNVPLCQREDMPAPTFYVDDKEKVLIDTMVSICKEQNISQKRLAEITGNKQQSISRIEHRENSPSLKLFVNLVEALGYDLQIVKK